MSVRDMQNAFATYYGYEPPWVCYGCDELIVIRGNNADALVVHHIDEDRTNNWYDNLVPMHRRCHVRLHRIGAKATLETLERLRVSHLGRTMPESTRVAVSRACKGRVSPMLGRTQSQDARERIGAAMRVRSTCEDCGLPFTPNWMTRHRNMGMCK